LREFVGVNRRNIAQFCDPVQQGGICSLAIRRFKDCRQHTEQLVIPMQIAGCDSWVVIFQEAPDLAQGCEIFDLHSCKLF
jgi:hypothetical protein